jgi:two-component system, cell cycle sensor histidine kinase and response regulator CckA
MNDFQMPKSNAPSPVRTISVLLLVIFGIETLIMFILPHLLRISNVYLDNLADATLLVILFSPVLYHYVFHPFQKIAAAQKSLTENVLANVVDGVVIFDQDLVVHSFNAAAERIFGYASAEMIGHDLSLILAVDCLEDLGHDAGHRPEQGAARAARECSGTRKDGSRVSLELSLSQVQLAGSAMRLGIIRDICLRKQGEAAVKQTLSLLNATLESTAEGIIVRDLSGKPVISNRRFAEMWGLPQGVAASNDLSTLNSYVLDLLKDPQHFIDLTERQRLDPELASSDILFFRDGRVFERVATPQVVEGTVVGRVICCRDITEEKNLENQLRHAQKMEALGTLAGGVAHDFNNILTVIMGYCNLTAAQLEKDSPLKQNLNQIMTASERAATLTNSLLAYSRKQAINPMLLDLNQCVLQVEKFLERLIGEHIELVTKRCHDKLTVLADSGQIEQVLMNLAANARDAMDRRGCLSIGTGRISIDQEFVRLHGYGSPGDFALISVSDTGTGMDEATSEKIFEPFFTTKALGQGTGLGLSIVYGIIKQHNGYINVYSEPGHGTTFNIYLPLCAGEQHAPAPERPQVRGGTETILLAEDDAGVRALVKSVLTDRGYRVIEAVDGEDGVAKFLENQGGIDLLILDVVMPKKNGKETFLEIRASKPQIKAIFISGYTADIIDKNGLVDQGLHLINKPLLPNQLLDKVREVLDLV